MHCIHTRQTITNCMTHLTIEQTEGQIHKIWLCFQLQLEAKDVLPIINRTQTAERAKIPFFVPGDPDFWPMTLTFKLVRPRDQKHLPCEFCANLFSGSGDISYTKHQTNGAKNRTFRSSRRAVINNHSYKSSASAGKPNFAYWLQATPASVFQQHCT